jgi:DNA-binding NarL/FixJ family response regulator
VVLTTFEPDEYVFAALRAGASGFLLKDIEPGDLRAAVRVVAAGNALLSPSVTRTLIETFAAGPTRSAVTVGLLATLTDRGREITALAAHGMDNAAIAGRPAISPATVKTYITPGHGQGRGTRPGATRRLRLPERAGRASWTPSGRAGLRLNSATGLSV